MNKKKFLDRYGGDFFLLLTCVFVRYYGGYYPHAVAMTKLIAREKKKGKGKRKPNWKNDVHITQQELRKKKTKKTTPQETPAASPLYFSVSPSSPVWILLVLGLVLMLFSRGLSRISRIPRRRITSLNECRRFIFHRPDHHYHRSYGLFGESYRSSSDSSHKVTPLLQYIRLFHFALC